MARGQELRPTSLRPPLSRTGAQLRPVDRHSQPQQRLGTDDVDLRFPTAQAPAQIAALLQEVDQLMLRQSKDWLELMADVKLEASA